MDTVPTGTVSKGEILFAEASGVNNGAGCFFATCTISKVKKYLLSTTTRLLLFSESRIGMNLSAARPAASYSELELDWTVTGTGTGK